MTLLDDFRKLLEERRELLRALDERIQENTARIEQLMARNAADQEARVELVSEVGVLESEIARLSEHAPVAPPPEPVPAPTSSDSRREAEKIIRERRAAETAATRRQKPKPDPVKAARKAARLAREQEKPADAGSKPGRYAKDPLRVLERNGSTRGPQNHRTHVSATDGVTETKRLSLDRLSPTQTERTDLLCAILEDGARSQAELALEMMDLLGGTKPGSAQGIVSECVRIALLQKRIIYTGQKVPARPGGRNASPVWKHVTKASPAELAAAGDGLDEEYGGTTTRWPKPETVTGLGRITEETTAFETKR